MAKLTIGDDTTFDLEITVNESDVYSRLAHVKFEKNHGIGKIHDCNEMFLTPEQLETLGRFLIRQADDIRSAQSFRRKEVNA